MTVIGKDTFNKNVKKIKLTIDITNAQPKDASIAVSNGELVVTYNLNDGLNVTSINDWKEVKKLILKFLFSLQRICDALGILVEIGDLETESERVASFNKVLSALSGSTATLLPEWSWTKSSQFLSMHPTKRIELVHRYNTDLMRKLLNGETAFADKVALCEFTEVVKDINSKIKTFHVVIFPNNDAKELVKLQVSEAIISSIYFILGNYIGH
jgi:hypothetical protein